MILGKYLPLGTVCELNNGYKKLMIIGYLLKSDEKIYDYAGCFYPEGLLFSDRQIMFNHDQIKKIYHAGCVTEESKKFNIKLENIRKQLYR